jgi:hypothetical protein
MHWSFAMRTKLSPIYLLTLLTMPVLAALLSSCSSPPALPTVDESLKRPANSAMAVDLQTCKSDLHNTRIQANESNRLADLASATLERVSARQQAMAAAHAALAAAQPRSSAPETGLANTIFAVNFGIGSTRVLVPDELQALIEGARIAPLIVLRGQVKGTSAPVSQMRTNRQRVAAVRDHLVAAGVDAARIRATFASSNHQVEDTSNPQGERVHRRVEVEVYRVMPVVVTLAAVTSP